MDARSGQRLSSREIVAVRVMHPRTNDRTSTDTVHCTTIDVSTSGLRLLSPQPIIPKCILDICLELEVKPQYILLSGEVRWCQHKMETDQYEIGVIVYDTESSDYTEWAKLFD
ncbi:hypothetical protein TI04_03270 [Achromatium sp. WMS2]|nr:hypothetical protein TI04_03270 [Achromatium sp. WMS2]